MGKGREECRQQLAGEGWESRRRWQPECSRTRHRQGTQSRQPCLQAASRPGWEVCAGTIPILQPSPTLLPSHSGQATGWAIDAVKPWTPQSKASPSSAFPRLLLLTHAGVSSECRASVTSARLMVSSCQMLR